MTSEVIVSADDAVAVGTLVGRIVQTRNAEGNETTTKPRDSTSKTPAKHVTSHNNKVIVAKFQQSQTCFLVTLCLPNQTDDARNHPNKSSAAAFDRRRNVGLTVLTGGCARVGTQTHDTARLRHNHSRGGN